jgi:hypothetical protein
VGAASKYFKSGFLAASRHREERSDAAIQEWRQDWMASLAMMEGWR